MVEEPPRDYAAEPPAAGRPLEQNLKSRSTWLRLLFMILFGVLFEVTRLLTAVVVVVQFFHVLFTGEPNARAKEFGQSLASYAYQVVRYLTFNTEVRPFPFDAEWPNGEPRD
jgi:Flp pilus assembly protein TadB